MSMVRSSSNKYLEIYNGTGDVSLDDVFILGNYNGNPWARPLLFNQVQLMRRRLHYS